MKSTLPAVLPLLLSGCVSLYAVNGPQAVDTDVQGTKPTESTEPSGETGWPETGLDSDSAPAQKTCGNGQLDAGEACDGDLLDDQTCVTAGFASGTLACDTGCALDTSACELAPPSGVYCVDPAATISAAGPNTVSTDVAVPISGRLDDVAVYLEGSHSWVLDLAFEVEHDGVVVALGDPNSSCTGFGLIQVEWSDSNSGNPSSCDGWGDYTGTKRSAQSLSAFVGQDVGGTWTVRTLDTLSGDGGSVSRVCVNINPTP